MLEIFIAAALLATGGVLGASAWRQHRRLKEEQRERALVVAAALATERGLGDPRPGDVVTWDGRDYLVAGAARGEAGERAWWDCRLLDGQEERWLVAWPAEPDWVHVGRRIHGVDPGSSPPLELERDGQVYRFDRDTTATVDIRGDLGAGYPVTRCEAQTYKGPGPARLWLRRTPGGGWLVFAGEELPVHMLTVLPGS